MHRHAADKRLLRRTAELPLLFGQSMETDGSSIRAQKIRL